jgi:hypothetical protein
MKNTTGMLKNKEFKLMLIHLLSQSDVRIVGSKNLFKIKVFVFSLFTKIPQPLYDCAWYYRKGKKVSAVQLFMERYEKSIKEQKEWILNNHNIHVK